MQDLQLADFLRSSWIRIPPSPFNKFNNLAWSAGSWRAMLSIFDRFSKHIFNNLTIVKALDYCVCPATDRFGQVHCDLTVETDGLRVPRPRVAPRRAETAASISAREIRRYRAKSGANDADAIYAPFLAKASAGWITMWSPPESMRAGHPGHSPRIRSTHRSRRSRNLRGRA